MTVEPLTHGDHHGRKPIRRQPDRDPAHRIAFPELHFADN
jgi:hypothetical protein